MLNTFHFWEILNVFCKLFSNWIKKYITFSELKDHQMRRIFILMCKHLTYAIHTRFEMTHFKIYACTCVCDKFSVTRSKATNQHYFVESCQSCSLFSRIRMLVHIHCSINSSFSLVSLTNYLESSYRQVRCWSPHQKQNS